nr:MAG TPA: hypothetical protein [Caudoviricetes sp.]
MTTIFNIIDRTFTYARHFCKMSNAYAFIISDFPELIFNFYIHNAVPPVIRMYSTVFSYL